MAGLFAAEIEEKRDSARIPCKLEIRGTVLSPVESLVDLVEQRQLLRGVTENISRGGIGMFSDELLPLDAVVRCEFAVPGRDVIIPTLLKVRWSSRLEGENQHQVGLQFLI